MKSITTGVVMVVIIVAIIIAEGEATMEVAETHPTIRTEEETSAEVTTVGVDVIKEVTMAHMDINKVHRVF
jgi:hypothetical protein